MDVMPKWADVVLIPLVAFNHGLCAVWPDGPGPVAKTRGTRSI